ncbi:MAG TPA: AmmeMemoRadiSam system protein B [Candidatus Nanoarchaeia archaeon]|nr:AmmeMemoRadiSam system protein B [Candidatus Nanoarchaeia archaeon]
MEWYPSDSKKLKKEIEKYLSQAEKEKKVQEIKNKIKKEEKEIHGLIVPHAGYEFSGSVAAKAYSLINNKDKKFKKAIIIGPSHQAIFRGVSSVYKLKTPLGEMPIMKNSYSPGSYEHSIDNQIPFLQYLGIEKVLPLVIGQVSISEIEEIAKKVLKKKDKETIIIISTDLSHFNSHKKANIIDKSTINTIEKLERNAENLDACGIDPLLIMMEIAKKEEWKPELIEYKNSGDTMPSLGKEKVVGYASMVF